MEHITKDTAVHFEGIAAQLHLNVKRQENLFQLFPLSFIRG